MNTKGPIDEESLETFRLKYEEEKEANNGVSTQQTMFNYAFCLVQQADKENVKKGVSLLRKLYELAEDENSRRDYLYFLALGESRLGNFEDSLKYVDAILYIEPENHQALMLKETINKQMKKEGLLGVGIFGAMMAAGGIIGSIIAAATMLSRRK